MDLEDQKGPEERFYPHEILKLCSDHFREEDFVSPNANKRYLRAGACPSIFSWTKQTPKRSLPEKRRKIEEMNVLLESELMETASEGEVEYVETATKSSEGYLSLLSQEDAEKNITYWNTKASKEHEINTSLLFNSDQEAQSDDDDEDDDGSSTLETDALSSRDHVLSMEEEFLLVMMKLRLGLTNLDLAIRFNVAEATISNTFISWLNLLIVQLGTLKIWPHRNVILEHMPKKFKEDYPNNIIIIDCTELKIQCPSSLVLQSQSYSNYKSTNTLKSLIGVDSMGGFMFVSQLYTGSISDKQIVSRSGFLDLLSRKKEVSEIFEGDSIMADKGFDIGGDLQKIGLQLNIPPFLKENPQFDESEVIRTQTIAKHRIHVERAIGK
ncbi:uncharacterized protein, partial [Montipora capricornis]|uniref:uncharacterized protein n=1 Tax=Montipora capricornis TaxID=246305 RepID=UPI0035F129F5